MYRIPSSIFLKGTDGRPVALGGFSLGKIFLISSHSSSGILNMVQLSFLSFSLLMDTGLAVAVMTTSYISTEFWDRLLINLVFVAVALHKFLQLICHNL
jgi:hypothetical protein